MPLSGGYFYPGMSPTNIPGSGIAGVGKGPIDAYLVGSSIKDASGREALISAFGELQSAERIADISLAFAYGLSTGSQGDLTVSRIKWWFCYSDGFNAFNYFFR